MKINDHENLSLSFVTSMYLSTLFEIIIIVLDLSNICVSIELGYFSRLHLVQTSERGERSIENAHDSANELFVARLNMIRDNCMYVYTYTCTPIMNQFKIIQMNKCTTLNTRVFLIRINISNLN